MAMPRWARRSLILLGALGLLVAGAAIALPFLVDVNLYRPLIAARIQEATGRSVTLGTISFYPLPSPGLTVAPLAISESARYPGRDALRARSLSIHLDPIGLLHGQLTITSVVLLRPEITLIREAGGRWNFDDLLARAATAPPAPSAAPAGKPLQVAVERAVVKEGMILIYDDAVVPGTRSEARIGPVDAEVRGWGGGEPTAIDLSAGLGESRIHARGRLIPAGETPRLELEAESDGLRAADLVGILPWLGVARPAGLQIAGTLELKGTAEVPLQRPESMRFRGTLLLRGLSYKDATMTAPLRDLSGRVTVDGERAVLEDFQVSAGTSSLRGKLQVQDYLRPRVGFTLTSPRLDANELIGLFVPARPAAAAPRARPAPAQAGLLDQVTASGTLSVAQGRFQTFDLSDLKATVVLERGVFTLKDLKASLYGGGLGGTARADLAGAAPRFALGARLEGVEVNPLLTAYDPGLKDLLGGRLNGVLNLDAQGVDMNSLLGTARGTGSVEVTQGRLASFSVLKQLAGLLETAGGKGIGRDETPFEYLRGSLEIADRRARTGDLALHSADLDLEGKGWVGLDATLELKAVARFSEESTQGMLAKNPRLRSLTDPSGRLAVHFGLSGGLAAPRFAIDTGAQVDQARERAKDKVRDKLRDRILDRLRKEPPPQETPAEPPQ
jgi:AsmA protein